MPIKLRVCPFSVLVFVTTAILVTRQKQRQEQLRSSQSSNNDNEDDRPSTVPLHVVFVLGPPGVGKGTQCQLLSERLPHQRKQELWVHLSAGDLLRAERAKGSTLAKEINQYIDAGQLVPSHITCQLLLNAMIDAYHNSSQRAQGSPVTHFLIDGFPRSQSNLDAWNAMTKTNDSTDATTTASTVTALTISPPHNTFSYHVQFVLNYSCPEETLVGRILERAKTQSRTDDNITTIQARFRTFEQETKPILEYYQSRYNDAAATGDDGATQVPVYTIATDQPVEAVYQQTYSIFSK